MFKNTIMSKGGSRGQYKIDFLWTDFIVIW